LYAAKASELKDAIDTLRQNKTAYETALLEERTIRRGLEEIVTSAVGGDRESLEHRLRTAGAALAASAGLRGVEVNSLPPRALGNPAATVRGLRDRRFQRTLRDRVDASEARLVIEGRGSLEGVLRAVALAESQPWTLGVESWTIKPERVEEGQPAVFSLSMSLSVLLVADQGAIAGEVPVTGLEEGVRARVLALAGLDPFATEPELQPVVAAAPPPPPPPPVSPPPPPPPAGEGWTLVGVIEGQSGQYAIVVHRDGRRMTLRLGQEVGGVRLAAVGGQAATFEVGEQRYQVRNGESLVDARQRGRP
jgi:hypothetical protein